MSFSEVREYQPGDDVRDIDWNVTARFGRPYVKVYEEERELTVVLLIDVSGSLDFGTTTRTQRELTAEIAATLAFSAMQNNDKVGVVFFSDHIEKFIPPKKGRRHVLRIIREIIDFRPESRRTDLTVGVEFLTRAIRKRCISFLISDFLGNTPAMTQALTIAARKHDLVAIRLHDRRTAELPNVGLMKIADAESGREFYVDTSSKKVRESHKTWWEEHRRKLDDTLRKCGVDYTSVSTDGDYVKALMGLFGKRN